MISKILFQISKTKQPLYVIQQILNYLPFDWQYHNYIDGDEINFFINNPLPEFPNIIDKYKSIKMGQHRADLFRYYVLYINGGVYLDSDAMIYQNIIKIIKEYEFITVNSIVPLTIFNGFICATKEHQIIYQALTSLYNMDTDRLATNYLLICQDLYQIIHNNMSPNINLLYEKNTNEYGALDSVEMIDGKEVRILTHYQLSKTIPQTILYQDAIKKNLKLNSKFKFYYRK